jgi:hypothetical protein
MPTAVAGIPVNVVVVPSVPSALMGQLVID